MSLVLGAVFDANADEQGKCNGHDCYAKAFYLNCLTVGTSVLVSLYFAYRK